MTTENILVLVILGGSVILFVSEKLRVDLIALMVLLGVLTMDEAYKSIQWKSVFLIAGMLPLGIAMQNTGTAAFLAEQITGLVGGLGDIGFVLR